MTVSNANYSMKFKLDLVIGAILNKKASQRASGHAESSDNALNVDVRDRDQRRGKQLKHHSISRGKSKGQIPMAMATTSVSTVV